MLKRFLSGLLAVVLAFGILVPQSVNAAAAMTSSQALQDVLKEIEGFSAKPYWDYSQWTVGYGTKCPSDKLDEYKANGITRAAAQKLLEKELIKIEKELNSFVSTYNLKLKQNQFDALVSFSYNCGTGWINEKTGYFNTAVRQGDVSNAFLYAMCLWSSAGGEYILIDRRMSEANMYINGLYKASNAGGTNIYPDNFRWVYLDGNGGEVRYKLHAYNADDPKPVEATFSSIPGGMDKNGKAFTYTLAGWYTEDGRQVTALDSSLSRGQILYAKWKDPAGNIVSLPKGQTPRAKRVVVTGDGINIRSGPGTHYPKVGTARQGMVLEITEVYESTNYTWGKTPKGWLSLNYTNYGKTPVITRQPDSVTAAEGGQVNISVEVAGTGLRYQWYVALPGTDHFYESSVTTDVYTTTMNASRKGRRVYCVVTDESGNSLQSDIATMYMGEPLTITQQPVDTAVAGGSTAAVTVKASGEGLRYQWYYCNRGEDTFQKSATTEATFSVEMNEARHGRKLYCEVTDKNGSKVRSQVVTISSKTAVITEQPKSVAVFNGETATVRVTAAGEGLKYQWYVCNAGDKAYSPSSKTTDTYAVTMDGSRAGRKLYCLVTDSSGKSTKSNVVTLNWDKTLTVTQQPAGVMVSGGQKATVRVVANGEGLKYQWYVCNAGTSGFSPSSKTTDTYSVEMNSTRAGRKLYCLITDSNGKSVKSNTVSINMDQSLAIIQQPVSVSVAAGQKATVQIKASGVGLKYQWYVCNRGTTGFSPSSKTTDTYSVTMDSTRDGRKLYCLVTDAVGNTVKSETVTISMREDIKIIRQPESVTVPKGATAAVSVEASGDNLTYRWYYCEAGTSEFKKSSISTPYYAVEMNSQRNGRRLYCLITDVKGNSVKTDTVTIQVPSVKITQQPKGVTVPNGATAAVSVKASGEGLKYQWYYCEAGTTEFKKSSINKATYSVEMNAARNGRKLYCLITDAYGNSEKTNTVTIQSATAVILQQPKNAATVNGQTLQVSVKAGGAGLKYQWYYCEAGTTVYKKSSITTDTYTVEMNAARNGRKLYCLVTDAYGGSVKTNTVTIKSVPLAITRQPENGAAPKGSAVSVSLIAEGTGLRYQWYVALPGTDHFHKSSVTTDKYVTTMDASRNGRRVYCVVTDTKGNSLRSDTVTITMGKAITITQQLVDVAAAKGETATVTVKATGTGLKYQWYVCNRGTTGFSKSSITSNVYEVVMDSSRSGRRIYCLITDAAGNTVKTETVTLKMA